MPRVHHVKKARKDNPAVKAGEPYYWWKSPYSPKRYSKTYPKTSQLVTSDKLARFAEANESIEDEFPLMGIADLENMVDILEDAAQDVREVGEEYQEGADNQREYFPDSEQADESEEKAYACEAVADNIEMAKDEIQQLVNDDRPEDEVIEDANEFVEAIDWSEFGWV